MTDQRITSTLVRSAAEAWRSLPTPGVSVKGLRVDRATGGSTALVRFEAGTRFPAHDHPGGEEVFVVEGDLTIGGDRLGAGDYLYTPPNGKHAASSETGCVFLVTLPRPVEILEGRS
jgi:quercetin dioxygenase-like cupin family protein